jgi:hypothetical protein
VGKYGPPTPLRPDYLLQNLLFFPGEFCIDGRMPKTRHLRDVYRFPGFDPLASVHGIFGDPVAVVVTLQRRQKKPPVGFAVRSLAPFTIKGRVESATFRVVTSGSISISSFVGFSAAGVAP